MAKAKKDVFDFDFTKFAGSFDPAKMTEEFTKAFNEFKLPGVDVNSMVAAQQKNLEALTTANKTAVEGLQAVVKRQAELMQQSMEATVAATEDLVKSGSPQEAAGKQVDLVKATFEKTLSDMTEISEMLAKSSSEASATINKRITESLDEVKNLAVSVH